MKPLCIDLFCGKFGWGRGFSAEGYHVIGFDIEHQPYHGPVPENCELVLQDVCTLHGSQFRNAACIVASPPCQEFSKYAMPFGALWREHHRMDDDGAPPGNYLGKPTPSTRLFHTCFRLQREASEAAGHPIPLIVENVKGAARFVGNAAWHYGSFYLWGNVPALMPITFTRRMKSRISAAPKLFSQRVASTPEEAHALHYRMPDGTKTTGHANQRDGFSHTRHLLTNQRESDAIKQGGSGPAWFDKALDERRKQATAIKVGDWFGSYAEQKAAGTISPGRLHGSRSDARRAASAEIAMIPFELSSHIARVYKPR